MTDFNDCKYLSGILGLKSANKERFEQEDFGGKSKSNLSAGRVYLYTYMPI